MDKCKWRSVQWKLEGGQASWVWLANLRYAYSKTVTTKKPKKPKKLSKTKKIKKPKKKKKKKRYWQYIANGDRYEGNWKEDKRDGSGIYYYANGAQFKGNFLLFFLCFFIIIYLFFLKSCLYYFLSCDLTSFLGTWKADRREGKGAFTTPKGDTTEGLHFIYFFDFIILSFCTPS